MNSEDHLSGWFSEVFSPVDAMMSIHSWHAIVEGGYLMFGRTLQTAIDLWGSYTSTIVTPYTVTGLEPHWLYLGDVIAVPLDVEIYQPVGEAIWHYSYLDLRRPGRQQALSEICIANTPIDVHVEAR